MLVRAVRFALALTLVTGGLVATGMTPAQAAPANAPGPVLTLPATVSSTTAAGQTVGGAGTAALNNTVRWTCNGGAAIDGQQWFTLPTGNLGTIRAKTSAQWVGFTGRGAAYLDSAKTAIVNYTTGHVLSCGAPVAVTNASTVAVVTYLSAAQLAECRADYTCVDPAITLVVGKAPPVPGNDAKASAHVVGSLPYSESTDSEYATVGAEDPPFTGCLLSAIDAQKRSTTWWKYTATASGPLPVGIAGAGIGVGVDIYDATGGGLTPATPPDAECPVPAYVSPLAQPVDVVAGHTYLIEAYGLLDVYYDGLPPLGVGRPFTLLLGTLGTPAPTYLSSSSVQSITSTSVTLSLVAPAVTPGTPAATSFVITRAGAAPVTVPASTPTYTATGLTPGATYTFTVTAVNANGSGLPLPLTTTLPNPGLPGAPTITSTPTSAAAGTATINWTPPTTGGAVTGYVVSRTGRDVGGNGAWTSAVLPASTRSFTFRYLLPGSTYTLSVRAISAAGSGLAATQDAVLPGAPSVPLDVSASADATTRTGRLSWIAPGQVTSPITGYRVSRNGTDSGGHGAFTTVVGPDAQGFTFAYLNAYETYTFTVRALSAAGNSPVVAASPVSFTLPTPAKPTGVAATSGFGVGTVTWIAPTNPGASAITGYRIRRFAPGNRLMSTVILGPDSRRFSAGGLTHGATYSFDVTAINAAGIGSPSARSNPVVIG